MIFVKCDRCEKSRSNVKVYKLMFLNDMYTFSLCKKCYMLYKHTDVNNDALNTDEEREEWYEMSRAKSPTLDTNAS